MDTRAYGDTFIVALSGELDSASEPTVRDALARADQAEPRRLIIDLRELTFIDSTGLHLLASVCEHCRREGLPQLHVRPAPEPVHRIFQLTGLEQRLPFLSGS